jgi:hypothetical protein
MKKQLATYVISSELKGLGFDEPCIFVYSRDGLIISTVDVIDIQNLTGCTNKDTSYHYPITAPFWQQVIDWLREKHDIHLENGWCVSDPFGNSQAGYDISGYDRVMDKFFVRDFSDDYYIAREMSVLKSIEYIKNK